MISAVMLTGDGNPTLGRDMMFSVVMKTDVDEHFHVIATFDDRSEAEKLSVVCAKRVNKGLGEEFVVDDDYGKPEAPADASPSPTASTPTAPSRSCGTCGP